MSVASISPRPVHAIDVDDVATALRVERDRGLDPKDAAARLATHGPNELRRSERTTWWQLIAKQFRDPLVTLLLAAIVISLVAWGFEEDRGVPFDAIVIAAIVMVNAGIGAVQANRADRAAEALRSMTAARSRVIRGEQVTAIDASELVIGDVLVLEAGDAVTGDARLSEDAGLQVAEASLTGESQPVTKTTEPVTVDAALGDRRSMVFAGTAVVAGHGTAIVVATGMQTEIGHIASMLHETTQVSTPLEREVEALGKLLGSLVTGIAIVVMGALALTNDVGSVTEAVDILLVGVSLAVAAVPEGLPAVLSVVLAISVQRMAGRNALVKRLASAETLGAATTICTDKTGTLTRGEMTVRAAMVDGVRLDFSGSGYAPEGTVSCEGRPLDAATLGSVRGLFAAAVAASDASIEETADGWHSLGNPTEAALLTASLKLGGTGDELTGRRLDELPFTSDRKRMSVLVESTERPGGTFLMKGAPDVLLERCSAETGNDERTPMSEARRMWWNDQVALFAADGLRTLGVARKPFHGPSLAEADEHDLEWLGLIGIYDPPRDEAFESVDAAKQSGIRVLMVTGDHPATARQIAAAVGIAAQDDPLLTGPDIDTLTDDELVDAVTSTSVYARVAPAHKLRLVRALQAQGHVVAMTGDGVNDAPALKAADLGTAMGISGTDVAREAADMILIDDNFATIVDAIAEGRTIFHNIRSFLRYLLSSNIGEVLTVLTGIMIAGWIGLDDDGVLAPLTAAQILWINLLTDSGPALALGVDPIDPALMRRPPRRTGAGVTGALMQRGILLIGATMAVVTLAMFDLQRPGGLIEGSSSVTHAQTAAFTVLVLAQLFNSFSARSDVVSARHTWNNNPFLLAAVALAFVLQIVVVHAPFMNSAFSTTPLSVADWLVAACFASVVLWVAELRKWLLRRNFRRASQSEQKKEKEGRVEDE